MEIGNKHLKLPKSGPDSVRRVIDYLTPTEAAVMARCNVNTIYGALQAGELQGFQRRKPKGRWLIDPAELDKWIRDED